MNNNNLFGRSGLEPKGNTSSSDYVKYIKELSEYSFISLCNSLYSDYISCYESSKLEDCKEKFDVKISFKNLNLKITGNIKDVSNIYTADKWLNPNVPKNFTIKSDDIKLGKMDVFIFPEYIFDESRNEYVTHSDFYIVSKSKIADLIERNKSKNSSLYNNYHLINLEYIKSNCIKLSDFSDLDKVKKYFNISDCNASKLDRYFINVAKLTSELSYGRRAKVGAIVTKDNRIISIGYNGTPPGFDNNLEIENDDGTLTTKPEVIHAEMNAICYAAKTCIELDGATIYLTLSPCHECAKLIIQCGIKRVVYTSEYRDTTGLEILRKAGIVCEKIS